MAPWQPGQRLQAWISQDLGEALSIAPGHQGCKPGQVRHDDFEGVLGGLPISTARLVLASSGVALLRPAAGFGACLHVVSRDPVGYQLVAFGDPHGVRALAYQQQPERPGCRQVLDGGGQVGHVGRQRLPEVDQPGQCTVGGAQQQRVRQILDDQLPVPGSEALDPAGQPIGRDAGSVGHLEAHLGILCSRSEEVCRLPE